jgi:hypothetical protein
MKYYIIFLILFFSTALFSQDKDYTKDSESIDNVIAALYESISGDAGVQRDWQRFTNLFCEGAKLRPIRNMPEQPAQLIEWTAEDYVNEAGSYLEQNGFHEVEIHREVDQYGRVAHAFSTYESRRLASDEQPFSRGINSIQLFHDGERWWIVNIFWESESQQLPIPDKYLSKE